MEDRDAELAKFQFEDVNAAAAKFDLRRCETKPNGDCMLSCLAFFYCADVLQEPVGCFPSEEDLAPIGEELRIWVSRLYICSDMYVYM